MASTHDSTMTVQNTTPYVVTLAPTNVPATNANIIVLQPYSSQPWGAEQVPLGSLDDVYKVQFQATIWSDDVDVAGMDWGTTPAATFWDGDKTEGRITYFRVLPSSSASTSAPYPAQQSGMVYADTDVATNTVSLSMYSMESTLSIFRVVAIAVCAITVLTLSFVVYHRYMGGRSGPHAADAVVESPQLDVSLNR